ncbi:MAG: N-acetyl-D-Glu racemase DgcA [Alphaproteobacteria bacterium]
MSAPLVLTARAERFRLHTPFVIARGVKKAAEVVVAELTDGTHTGRGECGPNARYGESPAGVVAAIAALAPAVAAGLDREGLQSALPPGAARNAIDCAFWDLEAKRVGRAAWQLAGQPSAPAPVVTAFTLSIGSPDEMARVARANAARPLLKIKLGAGEGDGDRLAAVRAAAPRARLIVDANEGWTADDWRRLGPRMADAAVELVEQPLPADADAVLATLPRPVPVCADESCRDRRGLAALAGRYDAINIKLDKTGGLTEALALADTAAAMGLGLMVGCMLGTSLAMAPALLVARQARWVDLDGPLLLAEDRTPPLPVVDSALGPPPAALWG